MQISKLPTTQQGFIHTHEALALGLDARKLYKLRDQGVIEQLSHGLYRLADQLPLSDPEKVIVALRAPKAVFCLITALDMHNLTTEIPRQLDIAVKRGTTQPKIEEPPLAIYQFSGASYHEGIEAYELDGVQLKVYNREKTLADCFKYRHKLGLDICLEALKSYLASQDSSIDKLFYYAKVCRVDKVMRPYIEAFVL